MRIDWKTVRNFGRVKYFNLSYFALIAIPLVAELYEWVEARAGLHVHFSFPFMFRMLFFASLFYALAVGLYQYFCPPLIKQYESEEEYAVALQQVYERANPDKKLEIVLANLTSQQEHLRAEVQASASERNKAAFEERTRLHRDLEEKLDILYPSCVQRFLINRYERAMATNRWAAYVSGLLFALGTLIMLFLLLLKSLQVLRA